VRIAEKVFRVSGQRSRSYVYKCVNAILVKACIATLWRRGSLLNKDKTDRRSSRLTIRLHRSTCL